MRPKVSFPRTIVFSFALFMAAYLGSPTTAAQENAKTAPEYVAPGHILDGKKFIGPTGEKGKKVHHEDVLRFSDGKFTSSECFQYGFKGGPYTTAIEGDTIHFQAETISPTHGKMVWQGTLQGDRLHYIY